MSEPCWRKDTRPVGTTESDFVDVTLVKVMARYQFGQLTVSVVEDLSFLLESNPFSFVFRSFLLIMPCVPTDSR